MKRIMLTIACLCLSSLFLKAQSNVTYDKEKGIATIEEKHAEAWSKIEAIEGFRIQITAVSGTNSKNSIRQVEQQFLNSYPDIPTHITFAEPYFRLRIGDFHTRLEATETLERIRADYPGAFIIKDEIDFK